MPWGRATATGSRFLDGELRTRAERLAAGIPIDFATLDAFVEAAWSARDRDIRLTD